MARGMDVHARTLTVKLAKMAAIFVATSLGGTMKTVTATEAKNRFGALIGEVEANGEAIVVEHHGRPRAVIVSAEQWTELNTALEQARRQEAWRRLQRLAEDVRERNQDLTQDQVDVIADDIGNEVKRRIAQRWEARD